MEEGERLITLTVTRRVTAASREASRRNGAEAKHIVQSEEHKAKLRVAQAERRERERQERAALGLTPAVSAEKKSPGRPRKEAAGDPAPKRPRGRPKKIDGQTLT